MHPHIRYRNGFTIVELIIAGAISITMIGVGFSILQISLKGNKIDETMMGLSGRLNDTLDFILDEVKSGKRIIDNEEEITELNSNCKYPPNSEFLFGIRLPNQALVKEDYESNGNQINLNQVECPIVYTLRESNNFEKMPYTLVRYGPKYNNKGYYISPSFQEFEETVLLDGISSLGEDEKIICPIGWKDIKIIKGISYCIDQYKKSIEIKIEAEDQNNQVLKSVGSTGGFSLIQDESQIDFLSSNTSVNADSPSCTGGQCCWIGVCLKSNRVTYMIDRSYFMSEDFKHPNGSIVNGEWVQFSAPLDEITARINGKALFLYAIDSLKQHINKIPLSSSVNEDEKFYFQIIAFNNSSEGKYLFEGEPRERELNSKNKNQALEFLDNLSTNGNSIEPWDDLCNALESDTVGQVILLSATYPSKIEGYCVGEEGNYAEVIENYNRITRSKSAIGSLIIDSISLFHNFCESSKNYANNNWLGLISSGAESVCTHIK